MCKRHLESPAHYQELGCRDCQYDAPNCTDTTSNGNNRWHDSCMKVHMLKGKLSLCLALWHAIGGLEIIFIPNLETYFSVGAELHALSYGVNSFWYPLGSRMCETQRLFGLNVQEKNILVPYLSRSCQQVPINQTLMSMKWYITD